MRLADAMQGGECAAVRALQAGANAAARRCWQPKTHLFMGEYLGLQVGVDGLRRMQAVPARLLLLQPGGHAAAAGIDAR